MPLQRLGDSKLIDRHCNIYFVKPCRNSKADGIKAVLIGNSEDNMVTMTIRNADIRNIEHKVTVS